MGRNLLKRFLGMVGTVGTNWPVFSGEVLIGGIGTYLNLSHLWLEGVVFDSHTLPPYPFR
jgi:hypothetical protein